MIKTQPPGSAGGLPAFDIYGNQSLSHTMWECKYHLVWIPKCRKKVIYGELRKYLGDIFRELARQKECNVIEGHLCRTMSICWSQFHPNMRYLRSWVSSKAKVPQVISK